MSSLLLSHNNLRDISNIDQFPALRQLNLSHNQLSSPDVITHLKTLSHLEHLSIEGNPVCATLNFKALLVASLPSLKLLDGAAISGRTLEQARLRVAKDQELLDTLMSNYSALIRNHQLILKLKLKQDLMQTHPKCLQHMARQHREGDPQDTEPILRLIPPSLQDTTPLKVNLMKDLNTLNEQFNKSNDYKNMDIAYSEMMLRQKSKMAAQKIQIHQLHADIYNTFMKYY